MGAEVTNYPQIAHENPLFFSVRRFILNPVPDGREDAKTQSQSSGVKEPGESRGDGPGKAGRRNPICIQQKDPSSR